MKENMESSPGFPGLYCQGIFTSAHTPKESSRVKTGRYET